MSGIGDLDLSTPFTMEEAGRMLPNVRFEGSDEEKTGVLDLTDRTLRTSVGKRLFHEVVASQTPLTMRVGKSGRYMRETKTIILPDTFIPAHNHIVKDPVKGACVEKIPLELRRLITFFHEVCHFRVDVQGICPNVPVNFRWFENENEHAVICGEGAQEGERSNPERFPICENGLRKELGLRDRINHKAVLWPPAEEVIKRGMLRQKLEALRSYAKVGAIHDFTHMYAHLSRKQLSGGHALNLAAKYLDTKTVDLILFDKNWSLKEMQEALEGAASNENWEVADLILSKRDDWQAEPLQKSLMEASKGSGKERVESLLSKANDWSSKTLKEALLAASWAKQDENIGLILSKIDDWSDKDLSGGLLAAIYRDRPKAVALILSRIPFWSEEVLSAAFKAAEKRGNFEVVNSILTRIESGVEKSEVDPLCLFARSP